MRSLAVALSLVAVPVYAQSVNDAVMQHVLPGYAALTEEAATLAEVAANDCNPTGDALRGAFNDAFDAWLGVSHLRFGPSEEEQRAFALAFWPDPRGSTPKTLATLLRDADPVVESAEEFSTVSVAVRGFYAMEFLLYDEQFTSADPEAVCPLINAVARDIALGSAAIEADWTDGYAELMTAPGNDIYRTDDEAVRQLFTALSTGLEFTSLARLGRPLGTFERPRPNRAEMRRSGRSLRNVELSLVATRDLAAHLLENDPDLDALFARAIDIAERLDDPVFGGVREPQSRFRVVGLQSAVESIRRDLGGRIAPRLGIEVGFNALDGD